MLELKEIPNLPKHIKAGSDGQIYNTKTNKMLGKNQSIGDNGYCKIFINHKGYLKHRLIALAFIPNPNNLPEVNHKDGIKSNCSPDNLEWSTPSDNSHHAHDNGLRDYNIPVIMCNEKGEELEFFKHTQEAQKFLNKEGKHGVWEAITHPNGKRLNNFAYGYFWKRA